MVTRSTSKSEIKRRLGETQVAATRHMILDAAERLFLEKGLEHTTMADVARAARITTVTLYRYFPRRDPIAFEIAARKMTAIAAAPRVDERRLTPTAVRHIALGLIDHFDDLRDSYRYMGMFDHLYGDRYPDEALAAWYKDLVLSLKWGGVQLRGAGLSRVQRQQFVTLINAILCFLQKMAARGALLAKEQGVPPAVQLAHYRTMIAHHLDQLEYAQIGQALS